MSKKAIIKFCLVIFLALALGGYTFYLYFNKAKLNNINQDASKATDKELLSILSRNQDAKEYMEDHKDFKINKKEVLTIESIEAGKGGQNFKEVYWDLNLENGRYIKIDLINQVGDRGLITVIDYKEKTTLKAYGLMLFKAQASGSTTQ
jgi:hypothetical protein